MQHILNTRPPVECSLDYLLSVLGNKYCYTTAKNYYYHQTEKIPSRQGTPGKRLQQGTPGNRLKQSIFYKCIHSSKDYFNASLQQNAAY